MGHIAIVLGTRPEIIKLAPVMRECERRNLPYTLIHTGQHYSESLDAVFFEQLNLAPPEYCLDIGSGQHGQQTAQMIAGIEEVLLEDPHDIVMVQGDTNSVLAGALAASKLDTKVAHVEAGLRSFDRTMPEEVNRVLADHASDYLFAPTRQAASILEAENIPTERIFVTGNTVVDAVHQNIGLATGKSSVLSELGLRAGEYVLLTAHRAENVDDRARFSGILEGASNVADELGVDVLYPIHPRAKRTLESFDLRVPETVRLVEPQDYLDFLTLEQHALLVLTDSGGVQEEACILQVPCLTLRDNTERPETILVGANSLVGTSPAVIRREAATMVTIPREWENPFGDGTAATKIVDVLHQEEAHLEVIE